MGSRVSRCVVMFIELESRMPGGERLRQGSIAGRPFGAKSGLDRAFASSVGVVGWWWADVASGSEGAASVRNVSERVMG